MTNKIDGRIIDITGMVFHRLTALTLVGRDSGGNALWECLCECGNKTKVSSFNLKSGNTKSCGCWNNEHSLTHGQRNNPIYRVWIDIKGRCNNENNPYFKDYGGRGITYDDKWEKFEGFFEDMEEGYSSSLEIDRIDVNGNYCKENCRWVDKTVQSHNRRKFKNTSSKYKGVYFSSRSCKFVAEIRKYGVKEWIGTFLDESSAATAYDNRSEELYGDRPNKTERIACVEIELEE